MARKPRRVARALFLPAGRTRMGGLMPVVLRSGAAVGGGGSTLTNGATVTLTAGGYGVAGGSILHWDTFESHPTDTDINGLLPIVGNAWVAHRNTGSDTIAISTTRSRSGSKCVFISFDASTINGARSDFAASNQLFLSCWRYYTGTYDQGTDNHKMFYCYGTGGSDLPQNMIMIPASTTTWHVGDNAGLQVPRPNSDFRCASAHTFDGLKDAWHRWDFWIVGNTIYGVDGVANGIVSGTIDGVQEWNLTDMVFRTDAQVDADQKWDQWNLGVMGQNMLGSLRTWYDDIYVATTQARVELSTSPTWAGRGANYDLQRWTSWADGSISFTVNRGGLPNGTVYIYVIKADGTVMDPVAAVLE